MNEEAWRHSAAFVRLLLPVQSYAGDTWMLGMAVLHLLGGPEWWDELHSSMKCPTVLRGAIFAAARAAGEAGTGAGTFTDGVDQDQQQHQQHNPYAASLLHPHWHGDGLVNTLYFYIVMRGWDAVKLEVPAKWTRCASGAVDGGGRGGGSASEARSVWGAVERFAASPEGSAAMRRDEAKFRLGVGTAPGFGRLQCHLQGQQATSSSSSSSLSNRGNPTQWSVEDSASTLDLVQRMLCFDPARRPPLFDVLYKHPIFASLRHQRTRVGTDGGAAAASAAASPAPAAVVNVGLEQNERLRRL